MTIRVDEIGGDGCVLCLSLNEGSGTTVYDRSGYNNNGTIYGATWTSGVTGSALSFDGVDDYVEVPDSPSLDITDAITIEAWIKTDIVLIAPRGIVDKQVAGGSGYRLAIKNNVIQFGVYGGDIGAGYTELNGETIITDGQWHHLVGTWDGLNMIVYVDRQQDGTATQSGMATNDQAVYLGIKDIEYGGSGFFNGIIDSVRIYNRALSEEEIQAHYRGARLLPLR